MYYSSKNMSFTPTCSRVTPLVLGQSHCIAQVDLKFEILLYCPCFNVYSYCRNMWAKHNVFSKEQIRRKERAKRERQLSLNCKSCQKYVTLVRQDMNGRAMRNTLAKTRETLKMWALEKVAKHPNILLSGTPRTTRRLQDLFCQQFLLLSFNQLV